MCRVTVSSQAEVVGPNDGVWYRLFNLVQCNLVKHVQVLSQEAKTGVQQAFPGNGKGTGDFAAGFTSHIDT